MEDRNPRIKPPKHGGRQSHRLLGHDYSNPGLYFVTICVWKRQHLWGDVVRGQMHLSAAGVMVKAVWEHLPERFRTVILDEFVVMPDHFHGILVLGNSISVEEKTSSSAREDPKIALPSIIGAFKSTTTVEYIRGVRELGWPVFGRRVWQCDYYDRIIRSKAELDAVRRYIRNNPSADWHE